jgi:hypothetical protein
MESSARSSQSALLPLVSRLADILCGWAPPRPQQMMDMVRSSTDVSGIVWKSRSTTIAQKIANGYVRFKPAPCNFTEHGPG